MRRECEGGKNISTKCDGDTNLLYCLLRFACTARPAALRKVQRKNTFYSIIIMHTYQRHRHFNIYIGLFNNSIKL